MDNQTDDRDGPIDSGWERLGRITFDIVFVIYIYLIAWAFFPDVAKIHIGGLLYLLTLFA